jgi:glucokinase
LTPHDLINRSEGMTKVADQWLRDILILLAQNRTVTRAEILEVTGYNPASVSHALRYLTRAGVILKVGKLESKAGRRQEILQINAEAGYLAAIDLEGAKIRFALTNLVGDVRYRWEEEVRIGEALDGKRVVHGLQRVFANLSPEQRGRVLAIGVCHPGYPDRDGRVTAVNLGWHDFPIREQLVRAYALPVFLEGAHHTYVQAERWLGTARHVRNCVYVIVGQGVGAGCFVDDHLLEGATGIGSEFGHVVSDPESPDRCACGRRGCLEAIASAPNMVRQFVEATTRGGSKVLRDVDLAFVLDAARHNDPTALKVVDRAARSLGIALSQLVQILGPELIVLGGDIVSGQDLFLPRIRTVLASFVTPKLGDAVRITVSSLGLDIGLKGAAAMAFRRSVMDSKLLRERICVPTAPQPRAEIRRPRRSTAIAASKSGRGE